MPGTTATSKQLSLPALFVLMVCCNSTSPTAAAAAEDEPVHAPREVKDDFVFDNGQVKLGIKKSSGGDRVVLSKQTNRNLVNHFDRGRLIQQQSYYGDRDGSRWGDRDWR